MLGSVKLCKPFGLDRLYCAAPNLHRQRFFYGIKKMILMFEHDRKGGFSKKLKIEKFPVMTRIIWGYWSIAFFEKVGINDLSKSFAKIENAKAKEKERK